MFVDRFLKCVLFGSLVGIGGVTVAAVVWKTSPDARAQEPSKTIAYVAPKKAAATVAKPKTKKTTRKKVVVAVAEVEPNDGIKPCVSNDPLSDECGIVDYSRCLNGYLMARTSYGSHEVTCADVDQACTPVAPVSSGGFNAPSGFGGGDDEETLEPRRRREDDLDRFAELDKNYNKSLDEISEKSTKALKDIEKRNAVQLKAIQDTADKNNAKTLERIEENMPVTYYCTSCNIETTRTKKQGSPSSSDGRKCFLNGADRGSHSWWVKR